MESVIGLMRDQSWLRLAPLHNLFGKAVKACFWSVYIRVFRIENPLNTLIDLFNFFCTEYGGVIKIRTKEFAKNPVPVVEIDIAVSIGLIS
jgi:hypothetical protein